jgi:anti-sigma B factor
MDLPTNPEYVSVARLTVSAISNTIGFNVEEIEDIKIALSEACANAIRHSQKDTFSLHFELEPGKLTIQVSDQGVGFDTNEVKEPVIEEMKENGLGFFIIESLMDEVTIDSEVGKGTTIRMSKFLEDNK